MRVPLSWLREYVDVPADASVDDVFESLVSVGFEEEEALSIVEARTRRSGSARRSRS